jgi:hypothetical protein
MASSIARSHRDRRIVSPELQMHSIVKSLVLASALCVGGLAAAPAEARVVIGVGIGVPLGYGYYGPGPWAPYGYYPPRVVVAQPVAAPVPASPALPDPIFYPNNGQSAVQTESDRRACNQWAVSQPSAMADASVFQRATYACMEGRGYTVK